MLSRIWATIERLDTAGRCIVTCGAAAPVVAGAFLAMHHGRSPASAARADIATGMRQFEARDFEGAKASFDLALAKQPDSQDAMFYRARTLASMKRYGDALQDVLAVEQRNPTFDKPFVLGGFIYFALRDYGRSEAQLSQALALDPVNKLALFTRAQSLAYQHKYALAEDDLEKVVAIDPGSRKARFFLTGVYSREHNLRKARDHCHQLVRMDGRNANYPELCGLVEHRAGNFQAAASYYRTARQLDPDLPAIGENLSRALAHEPPVGSADSPSVSASAL